MSYSLQLLVLEPPIWPISCNPLYNPPFRSLDYSSCSFHKKGVGGLGPEPAPEIKSPNPTFHLQGGASYLRSHAYKSQSLRLQRPKAAKLQTAHIHTLASSLRSKPAERACSASSHTGISEGFGFRWVSQGCGQGT